MPHDITYTATVLKCAVALHLNFRVMYEDIALSASNEAVPLRRIKPFNGSFNAFRVFHRRYSLLEFCLLEGIISIQNFEENKNPARVMAGLKLYYLALALVFMQRAQAFTRWPSSLNHCKLGKSLTMEGLME